MWATIGFWIRIRVRRGWVGFGFVAERVIVDVERTGGEE